MVQFFQFDYSSYDYDYKDVGDGFFGRCGQLGYQFYKLVCENGVYKY